MGSIFSKIVSGNIPCYKIAENERCLAFLDIMPLTKGHTLVIPKEEIDYIYNVPDDLLAELHVFAKEVALKIEKVIPCERIGVTVIGLEVPHAHIHLIPINAIDDMNFSRPKLDLSKKEFEQIAEAIRAN